MDDALIGTPIHSSLVIRPEFTAIDGQLVGYVQIGAGQTMVPFHLPSGHCFVVRFDLLRKMPVLSIELDTTNT